jgi:molybdopterin synthase sulfur carrier subunit
MSIKVRYFANLKEIVGRSSDELNLTTPLSVREVWQQLLVDIPLPSSILVALNMEYVTLDTLVAEGDELAFFPPVTGG